MPKLKCNGERISVGEAAEMLEISESKLKKFMWEGKLPIGFVDETEKEGGSIFSPYFHKYFSTAILIDIL